MDRQQVRGQRSVCSSGGEGIDDRGLEEDLALADDEGNLARGEVVHKMRDAVKLVVP